MTPTELWLRASLDVDNSRRIKNFQIVRMCSILRNRDLLLLPLLFIPLFQEPHQKA